MYSDTKASHIDMNFRTENNFHYARNEEIIPESINNISNEPCYNCIMWKYKFQLLDNVLGYPNPRFCKQLMLQWQTNNSRVLQTAIRQYLNALRALTTGSGELPLRALDKSILKSKVFFIVWSRNNFNNIQLFQTLKLITLFFTKQVPSFYVLLKYLNCFSKKNTKFIYYVFIIQGETFHSFFINLACISQLFWLILRHNAEPLEAQDKDDFRLSQLLSRSRWQSYD